MIERWELIQAQSLSEKHRHKQNLQQWQQLISDLQTMRAWLGQSEAELSQLRGLELSTDIHTIQQRIKKLKVCLLHVCVKTKHNCSRLISAEMNSFSTDYLVLSHFKISFDLSVFCNPCCISPCTVYFQESCKKYSLSAVI